MMGDAVTLAAGQSLRLHARLPEMAELRLLRNGRIVAQGRAAALSYDARDTGVYRVEAWKHRWGKPRGWIFSNPIYLRHPKDRSQQARN